MAAEFQDRVALVTGGSRGIGRATALRLASEGAHVAISYGSRSGPANEVVTEIQKLGRKAIAEQCNVGQPADIERLVARTRRELGPISFLAHCGAISNLADHNELSYDIWREMIEVNLTGAYLAVFAVKDEMLAQSFGRIVMVSSIAALLPRQNQIHYSASKAGRDGADPLLCRGLRSAPGAHQLRRPRAGRYRDGRRASARSESCCHRGHADAKDRPARGASLGDPLFAQRRIELYDRPERCRLGRPPDDDVGGGPREQRLRAVTGNLSTLASIESREPQQPCRAQS